MFLETPPETPRVDPPKSLFPSVEEEASNVHVAMKATPSVSASPICTRLRNHNRKCSSWKGLREHLVQASHEETDAQRVGDLTQHKAILITVYTFLSSTVCESARTGTLSLTLNSVVSSLHVPPVFSDKEPGKSNENRVSQSHASCSKMLTLTKLHPLELWRDPPGCMQDGNHS